ncbi:D-alanyl-D-alanine endopeptidase [Ideonella sp. A 288]|uniref:D-alanyl-D-alanine endopeptidase n=1 Tax=Ideonella sp. A 288 TaxID=1962181 RepID=UPI000B4B1AA3|nr:D-alanyl-D-alanine endopeptidase [Ideonella sp. A 288]
MTSIKFFALVGLLCFGLALAPAEAARKAAATSSAKPAKSAKPVKASKAVGRKPGASRAAIAGQGLKARRGAGRQPGLRVAIPERPSFGQIQGLHAEADPLELRSSVALVVDQDTSEVLFSKNSEAVLPIASITKLMTGLVVLDASQSMDEMLTITQDDIDTEKGSRSRLAVGTQLTRGDMMHLALMASENRAAHALGRHYPGGLQAFVKAMNLKAGALGMKDTRYVEPTGLSSQNQSSANDLARLVIEAHRHPVLRDLSTSQDMEVPLGRRVVQFRNTNGLVRDPQWDIGLQKTGYISEAGRCLVMQASMAGRKLVMVLLDSAGKFSRIGDAERIRRWLSDSATQPARRSARL